MNCVPSTTQYKGPAVHIVNERPPLTSGTGDFLATSGRGTQVNQFESFRDGMWMKALVEVTKIDRVQRTKPLTSHGQSACQQSLRR